MNTRFRSLVALGILIAFTTFPALAGKSVSVKGYTKKDGTYVAPHQRSSPDGSKLNNYSTKGNVNPYTGKAGTVNPTPGVPAVPKSPALTESPKTNGTLNVDKPVEKKVEDSEKPTSTKTDKDAVKKD